MKRKNSIVSKKYAIYAKKGFNIDENNKKCHKVRDHCYYAGKYRGAAHDICNLKIQNTKRNSCTIS